MNLSITEPLGISQAKVDELSKQYLPAELVTPKLITQVYKC